MTLSDVSELKVQIPPAGFIVKDVIGDFEHHALYNYEDWLRELINESSAFMSKTGGVKFEAPYQEAHGEADAITNSYCLDFKLAAGQSLMHALRETSRQLVVKGGLTLTTTSRRCGPMKGAALHVALRQRSESDLRRLWSVDSKRDCSDDIEREIVGFLKLLKTKKNLLILFPLVLYTEGGAKYSFSQVSKAVYSDFRAAFELRRELNSGFDSYLAFITDQHLVIVEGGGSGKNPFDCVPLSASKTFMDIAWRYIPSSQQWLNELVGLRT